MTSGNPGSRQRRHPTGQAGWLLTVLLALAALALTLVPVTFLPPAGTQIAQAAEPIDTATLRLIDDRTRITLAAFRLNRVTNTYLGTATLTNTGADALAAPLYLVVASVTPAGASVVGADGLTTNGKPYFDLTGFIPGGTLAPAAVAKTLSLQMKNPTAAPIQLGLHLYARAPPVNRPPTANAGPDQTAPVGRAITLDGSGSTDPEGRLLRFNWSFLSRPTGSTAVLSGPTLVNPSFSIDRFGDYQIQLIVNDGATDSAPDTVAITTQNTAPVANAGPDQSGFVGDPIHLNGSASTDVDGDPLTYLWSLVNRPADSTAELSDTRAVAPGFALDWPGTYVAQLIVNDGALDSAPDTVTVSTENSRPVANAGPDRSAWVGDTLVLDGTASTDADQDQLTYAWSLLSRPAGSAAALTGAATASPRLTIDRRGSYVAQLQVNDGHLDSAPDTATVTTGNVRPVADAGQDQTATVGAAVTLDGSGSSDADGDPLDYQWSLLSVPAGSGAVLAEAATETPGFVADLAGLYVAQLVVSDGDLTSDPDTSTVEVLVPNRAPRITSVPTTAATVGQAYRYDGEATDPDGGDTLTWSLDAAPAGAAIDPATGLIQWTPASAQTGDHPVRVRVRDQGGLFDTQAFTVGVAAPPPPANRAPVITSTPVTDATAGQPYAYDVDATDPDAGDVLTYSLPNAPSGTIIDPVSGLITWTPGLSQSGAHSLTVKVDDAGGLSATQDFTVEVTAPPPLCQALTARDDAYEVSEGTTLVAGDAPIPVAGLPTVPGYRVEQYATVPTPVLLAFDMAGNLFVGNDNNSGAVPVHRIPPGGGVAVPYGQVGIVDPDPVIVDVLGRATGQPGAVLAGGGLTGSGVVSAILPNQTVIELIRLPGSNPNGFAFDQSGRLLISDFASGRVYTFQGGTARTLFTLPTAAEDVTVDSRNRILTTASDGVVRIHDAAGQLINGAFATGLDFHSESAVRFGPGNAFGSDLYVVEFGARIHRVDSAGTRTPFATLAPEVSAVIDLQFGPDGAMYVADRFGSRVLRITPTAAAASSVLINDCDPDGAPLSASLVDAPANGTLTLSTGGAFVYTPKAGFSGTETFTYRAGNGRVESNLATVTVAVRRGNHKPTITSVPQLAANAGQPYAYDVEASDPDPGDALTYSIDSAPTGMTIDSGTGVLQWTPGAGQIGAHTVELEVRDRGRLTDRQSFTVSVAESPPPNRPPVITSSPVTGATAGQAYTYHVEATDPDAGDVLTYSLTTAPAGMGIDPATGLIGWTPVVGQTGDFPVSIRVEDQHALHAEQGFTVTVDPGFVCREPRPAGAAVTKASLIGGAGQQTAGRVAYADGQLFVAGWQYPPLNVSSYTCQVAQSSGRCSSALLSAFDSESLLLRWSNTLPGVAWYDDVAVSPTGLYPVGAAFPGTCGAGDGVGSPEAKNLLARYKRDGEFIGCQARTFFGYSGYELYYAATAVTQGSDQFVFATGFQQIDGGPSSYVVAKYDSSGNLLNANSSQQSGAYGLIQVDGNLYTAGWRWWGSDYRAVLAKFNLTPSLVWKAEPADGLHAVFRGVGSLNGAIYAVGSVVEPGGTYTDYLIEKYDQAGNRLWRKVYGEPQISESLSNTIGVHGRLFVVGEADDLPGQGANAATDAVVIEIAPETGDVLWSTRFGGSRDDYATGVSTDGDEIFVTGVTKSFATAEGNKVGDSDILLLKFALIEPCSPQISSSPVTEAQVTRPYVYELSASSGSGGTLDYSLATGPAGMFIDASTGRITWTPIPTQTGTHLVLARVQDSLGPFATQAFNVAVAAAPAGLPPVIESAPATVAVAGSGYTYQVQATDPNGEELVYALPLAPDGMGIDPVTGLITWTPSVVQVGNHSVTVRATDTTALFAEQSFTVVVSAPNRAPTITSTPPAAPKVGQPYTYAVQAADPDGDPLTYALPSAPAGMTIDPATGLIQWTPAADQVGSHPVSVRAADPFGASATQGFSLTVTVPNRAPSIDSLPPGGATVGALYGYGVAASDPDGDSLTYALTTAPAGMTIDPASGLIQWTPTADQVGDNAVTVRVDDGHGGTVTQGFTLTVAPQPTVNLPPVIASSANTAARARQLYGYPVTANDPNAGDVLTFALDSAPAGMVIDPPSGIIQWVPTDAQVGAHPVTVRVTDDGGLFDTQAFTVTVAQGNRAPTITSVPAAGATVGRLYVYAVTASDPDAGDTLSFHLDTAPTGMTIDPATGLVQWTPTADQVGSQAVTVRVQDQSGAWAGQGFAITVQPAPVNHAPSITSTPVTAATAGTAYAYDLNAADPDAADVLTYALDTAPAGMTIEAATGLIQWTPTAAQVGDHAVTARAQDQGGLFATQAFSVRVAAAPPPPPALAAIRVTPGAPLTLTGQGLDFVATGILADGTSQALAGTALWSSSAPAVAGIDATGYAVTGAAGTTTITARVGTVSGSATLTVLAPVPNGSDPVAAITAPAEGATVTEPTAVIGTAADPEILKYVLEIAPVGSADFQTIAEGAASVTNATLGILDPTLLINDLYQLRLTVYDRGGFYVQTTRQVQVAREQKVGNFTLAFQDLSTPMACMPLTVTRVYDSRDKGRGDFGVGWRLDVQTLRLRESGTMGDGWAIDLVQKPGPFGIPIPTYVLYDTAAHKVSLTLPDGQVEEFDLTPTPTESQFNPIDTVSLAFTPRPGTLGRLEPVVADSVIPSGTTGGLDLIDFDGETLDPRTYRYTTPEGNVYLIDKFDGVRQVQCTTGQTLTFGPDGIQHAGGKAVAFTRDAQGRITAITDPAGNVHVYSYDANGDLKAHTDPEAGATGFKYDYRHGLLEIIDPRGVRAVRNEYDASGRLIGTTDAAGQAVTFVHDLTARTETVTNRLGQVTHYAYDAAGNVLRETDALGNVTQHSYDAYGNELTRTDPLGRVTTMTYDSRRNRLTETDALGQVTGYSYTALNAVRTITDPLRRVTTNAYDSNGNLLSTVDPLNGTTAYTYDGGAIIPTRGLLLARTDALRQVTRYAYDGTGNLSRETDALGNVTDYGYDANGNRLTETRTRALPGGGSETLVTRHEYDRLNRLVRTTHPDGSTSRTEYNAIGKQARTLDAMGRETSFEYDDAGRLTRTIYPDGATESSAYDAEGRRLTSTDRAGRVTGFVYDALGRLVQTTYPDVTTTGTSYDAAGQVLSTTDALGHVTTYEYDLAGRRTKVIDALGQETLFTYDAAGNQTDITDANGHQVRFEYDAGNRRVRTLYPDSTRDQVGYDALGRQISKTDQAGLTTEYHYDALGRLAGVTDALGQDTTYGYDVQGNQVSQTDANGHTTTFGYDHMGRRVSRTLPLGMTETMTYDAAGNLATRTDFNGRTTSFVYDALNRLTEKRPDPATGEPVVRFTFTASGQRATMVDASGTTTYSYDGRDRLTAKATPAGTLSYGYDDAGNLLSIQSGHAGGASMTYAYDALNRLASVTDANSGVTTYAYDFVGNLAGYAYPNGVEHRYTYNALNRLTDLALVRGGTTIVSYAYTLGATGNRQSVTELSGRRAAYGYDDLYRLTSETVTGDPAGVNGTVGYDYDPVGNRLERTSSLAPIPAQTFSYDANDRIGVETYDDNGNTQVTTEGRQFGYDTDNRLVSADGGISFVYDGDGNRVARTVGGVTTGFLVDTLNPTGYSQVLEEIEGGAVVRRYTYGLDLVSQEQSSGVSFYGYDGHGSVRLLTDTAGVVTDTYAYDAFGNMAGRNGNTANVQLYGGEQLEQATSDYYLRARYVSPVTGRFGSIDRIQANDFEPKALHVYSFSWNNPVDYSDPTGLQTYTLTEYMVVSAITNIALTTTWNSAKTIHGIWRGKNTPTTAEWLADLGIDIALAPVGPSSGLLASRSAGFFLKNTLGPEATHLVKGIVAGVGSAAAVAFVDDLLRWTFLRQPIEKQLSPQRYLIITFLGATGGYIVADATKVTHVRVDFRYRETREIVENVTELAGPIGPGIGALSDFLVGIAQKSFGF